MERLLSPWTPAEDPCLLRASRDLDLIQGLGGETLDGSGFEGEQPEEQLNQEADHD